MYRNPGSNSDNDGGINILSNNNYNIIPDDTIVWDGDMPFKQGDTFPTKFISDRHDLFYTYERLYQGKDYNEIYGNLVNINDYLRDPVTNAQIFNLVPRLPEHRMITDTWVNLLAAKSPKVDGSDVNKISQVSTVLSTSNFAEAIQIAVRESIAMYGVSVIKVDKKAGGLPKASSIPVRNWIPFVSSDDVTTIEVNCVFSIFAVNAGNKTREGVIARGKEWFCEFILYHETGLIQKYTYKYNKARSKLGELVNLVEDEAFDGAELSPIVVFSGQRVGNSVYGEGIYPKVEAAITSSMQAYQTLLILLNRNKEIYRVMPEGATQRDEASGVTYMANTGTIVYPAQANESPPTVTLTVPKVDLENAIKAYQETVVRVSRDSGLTYTMFDTKALGTNLTGVGLKTSMFNTELQAKSYATLIHNEAKMLVVKLAKASGYDVDMADFTLTMESGFVNDYETLAEVVQKRNGGKQTLSVADSIALLDDVSMPEAESRARVLEGLAPIDQIAVDNTEIGKDSVVTEIGITNVSTLTEAEMASRGNAARVFPLGGGNING